MDCAKESVDAERCEEGYGVQWNPAIIESAIEEQRYMHRQKSACHYLPSFALSNQPTFALCADVYAATLSEFFTEITSN